MNGTPPHKPRKGRALIASSLVILLALGLTALFFSKIKQHGKMETDLDEYMPKEHPAFVFSDLAEEWFDIDDAIAIAVAAPEPHSIYTTETLTKIRKVTEALVALPEVEDDDVKSLYTAENISSIKGGFEVTAFFEDPPTDPAALAALEESVTSNEMVFGRLVSEDHKAALVMATIDDDVFSKELYTKLQTLVEGLEGPEKLYLAGRPIVEGELTTLGARDMKRMVPIVLFVITSVLLLVLRSLKGMLLTLLVVAMSVVWSFGLMAWLGVPVYQVSTMIPVMLIAIGVADGIHLLSHLRLFRRGHPDASKLESIGDMLASMWRPVAMTSVTTAVGFISLLTSEVYPIKYFGLFTAFGVLAAMVLSLSLIPAGLVLMGLPKGPKPRDAGARNGLLSRWADRFSAFIVRQRLIVLFATAGIIALCLLGATRIWINASFLDKFEEDAPIVRTDAFINAHFGGTSSLSVVLQAEGDEPFKDPALLDAVSAMEQEVLSLPVVGASMGLTTYLSRMNRVMHDDDPAFYTIPHTRDMVAQYLLLYEMSGDPENLLRVADFEYEKLNLTFQLKSDTTQDIEAAMSIVDAHRPTLEELGVEVRYAGGSYRAFVFSQLIMEGQIKSILLSLLLILVLISILLKSPLLGLIGTLPITATAIITFGVMGILDIPLSTTTALVSSIAIGIGIDYSIHFLTRYRHERTHATDSGVALAATMGHSGRAILFNALVVIAGFLVLTFSVFPPNRALGALVSLSMFLAFSGTVTTMAAILSWKR